MVYHPDSRSGLKNKLRNTWVVVFAAEGIVQLIVCDSGVQEANEK